jgi:hypothetical protein
MTEWMKVEDVDSIQIGDMLRIVTASGSKMEARVMWADDQDIELVDLGPWVLNPEIESYYVQEVSYAVLDRFLAPGEVVEDRDGVRYMQNPFNPARVISGYSGFPALTGLGNVPVRPVRS